MEEKEFGLYIHIPFCVRKCLYCDFCSFAGRLGDADAYVSALLKEAEITAPGYEDRTVASLFIGGGTPSLLTGGQMKRLMSGLRERFSFARDPEMSLEANPGTVAPDRLEAFRETGLNRISLGVQAVQDRLLNRLGRIHTFRDADEAVRLAREAGFERISVDLMTGLPGQVRGDLEESLGWALGHGVGHVSLYSLIVEEGTPFHAESEAGTLDLPDEEEEREWFADACAALRGAGLGRYEISNFARPGQECAHNLRYWRRQPYLGLGTAAVSMEQDRRWKNPESLEGYILPLTEGRLPQREEEPIPFAEQAFEAVMLGLRMKEGVDLAAYAKMYGDAAAETLGNCSEEWAREGLAGRAGSRVFLTDRGMDLQNTLLVRFWEALDRTI